MNNSSAIINSQEVKAKALALGFSQVGVAKVDKGGSVDSRLLDWLDNGYHADMEWMQHPNRQDIHHVMPSVRSLICVALNYYTPHQRPSAPGYGKISRYAWGARLP